MTSTSSTTPAATRRRLSLALALAPLAGLAACGGGGGSEAPAPPPPAPTLTILSNTVGTAGGPVRISFVFSDEVSGFAANRFLVTGGSIATGSFQQTAAREFAVIIQPRPNQQGTLAITVPPAAFRDKTGVTGNPIAYNFAIDYDTVQPETEPVPTFSDDQPGWLTNGPVKLTIAFNIDVGTSFELADLRISGGTASDFTRVSGTTYTLVLSPPRSTSGFILVDLPEGAVVGAVPGGRPNSRNHGWAKFYLTS